MAASKPPQILILWPASEIVFEGPFKSVVTSDLELKNPSDKRVCFKVKTTAPRRYCVRPNSGIIEPGSKIKIHIMLQPMDADGLAEGHKHKFMVQSIVLADDSSSLETVFAQTDPREIMDSKLRCVFHNSPQNAGPAAADSPSHPFATQAAPSSTTTTSSPSGTAADSARADATTAEATTTTTTTTSSTTAPPPTSSADNQAETNSKSSGGRQPAQPAVAATEQSTTAGREQLQARNLRQATSSTITQASPATTTTASTGVQLNKSTSTAATHGLSSMDSSTLNRSLLSSHNSSSFLQPIGEDRRVVLVSLIMLIIGVIVGKFII